MLAETFFQKSVVHTPKAFYRLWAKPEAKSAAEIVPGNFDKPKNTNGIVTEACGCRFNWNDRFYESLCAKHEEIERQREWAMEEELEGFFAAA